MTASHKLKNIQALRAVAVLLVVGVHLSDPYGFEKRYLKGGTVVHWLYLPGHCGVDLFFVISGLIMTLTTWTTAHTWENARSFFGRRLKRIYPIYWIVTIPVFLLWLVKPHLIDSHQAHAPQPVQSFLLLPQAGVPLLPVGWTLVYEMYFYSIFAVALAVSRKFLPWIIGSWAVVTVVMGLTVLHSSLTTVSVLADPIALEFAFGVAVGFAVMKMRPIAPMMALLAGTGLLIGVLVVAALSHVESPSDWLRALGIGPCCALIVYGAIGLENRDGAVAPPAMQTLGDASYSVYLWHVVILTAMGKVIVHFLPYRALHIPLLILATGVTVAVSVWLYFVLERPLVRRLGARRHTVPVQGQLR